jgi:hypothetical protein
MSKATPLLWTADPKKAIVVNTTTQISLKLIPYVGWQGTKLPLALGNECR